MRAWAWWVGLLGAVAGARELDPAACAPRFDVQRDKIIRTEESRDMGARYLSELDVGARHECLRLCCETDSCDVFVYEEKSPGSCYLFNCGPPEDFRCKFTAHSNFSSGVLALSRRLAELQDQERLAHHEQELANLRVRSTSTSSTSTSPAPPPPPPLPPAHHQPFEHHQQLPSGKCSRYQFECRRGGECIAVYNACDGVPQCADGSDEAPELGCPQPPPPLATRPAPPPPPPPPPPVHQPSPKPLQVQAQEPMEALVEGGGGGGGAESALALEEAAARDRWPHRLAQAQPQHRYNEVGSRGSSHIFSHKGGLLQEPEPAPQYAPFEPPAAPAAAQAAWPRHAWPHQPGMESMSSERGWGGSSVGGGGGGGYPRLEWPEPDPRRGWPVPQPRPEPEMPVYIPAKTMPEIPMVYSSQQQTLRDSPKKGFELNKPPPQPEPEAEPEPERAPGHAPTAAHPLDIDRREETPPQPQPHNATNTKLLKVKAEETKSAGASSEANKQASSTARRLYAPDDHDRDHEHDHDGLSEHPPAAVLLLVLGILMTTAMGAMVGCRARAARRRLRRGNKPYAHDADYLVNGMYL